MVPAVLISYRFAAPLGFALESCNAVSILCELFRQDLDRCISSEFLVLRLVHLSHAALAELACDLVMCECFPIMDIHLSGQNGSICYLVVRGIIIGRWCRC
jgi:hypothetical protein